MSLVLALDHRLPLDHRRERRITRFGGAAQLAGGVADGLHAPALNLLTCAHVLIDSPLQPGQALLRRFVSFLSFIRSGYAMVACTRG